MYLKNSRNTLRYAMLGVVLALGAGCASTPTSESTGEYVDNTVLTGKVKTALARENFGDLIAIKVKSYKGTVQLSGFVDSEDMVTQAGAITAAVAGVESVENSLQVKPAS